MVERNGNLLHSGFESVFGQAARPQCNHLPAVGTEQFFVLPVPFAVAVNLRLPERRIGFGQNELPAAFVPVPKTAVDEYRRSVLAHHDVRLTRYALDIQPVPVSVCPQPFPHRQFGLCTPAANMRHTAVALLWCQNIGHSSKYNFYNDCGSVRYAGGCVIENPCFVSLYVCLGLFGLSADVGVTYPF